MQIIVDRVQFRQHLVRAKHSVLTCSVNSFVHGVVEVMLIDSTRLVERGEPTLLKAFVLLRILHQFVLALVLRTYLGCIVLSFL